MNDMPLTPAGDEADHILHWPCLAAPALHLLLTPERAVYWPAERTLFVADMHLGKASVFRTQGIPVPHGTTTATLQALSTVIHRTGAERLVVLGDFLHAKQSQASSTMVTLQQWRAAHASLDAWIVLGNHDRHADTAQCALGWRVSALPYLAAGLIGVHEAHEARSAIAATLAKGLAPPLVMAGHVHPVVTLRGRLDRLRLPCFWLRDGVLTMPAFGAFTGGFDVGRQEGQRFVVGDKVRPA